MSENSAVNYGKSLLFVNFSCGQLQPFFNSVVLNFFNNFELAIFLLLYATAHNNSFCLDSQVVEAQLKVYEINILQLSYSTSRICHPFWEAMKTLCSYLL